MLRSQIVCHLCMAVHVTTIARPCSFRPVQFYCSRTPLFGNSSKSPFVQARSLFSSSLTCQWNASKKTSTTMYAYLNSANSKLLYYDLQPMLTERALLLKDTYGKKNQTLNLKKYFQVCLACSDAQQQAPCHLQGGGQEYSQTSYIAFIREPSAGTKNHPMSTRVS